MAGFGAVHQRFGNVPFSRIFEPAIEFADQGFKVYPGLAYLMEYRKDVLTRLPDTKKIFTQENGKLYAMGDVFKQPELAKTLRGVANEGVDYMYAGDWAKKFVAAVQQEGGLITMQDMADYRVIWSDPVHTTYRGYDVYTIGLPCPGGAILAQSLNLMEHAPILGSGHYTQSANTLYWLMQVSRAAFLLEYYPYLSVKMQKIMHHYIAKEDIDLQSLHSKATADKIWPRIASGEWQEMMHRMITEDVPKTDHTDAVVAVDEFGNIAAIQHTINTDSWGETGIFVDGISISDGLVVPRDILPSVRPGGYIPDPSNPLVMFKDGKPVLTSSNINSDQLGVTIQNLYNIVDCGMDAKTSVNTVNFLSPYWKDPVKQAVVKGTFSKDVLRGVNALGQEIVQLHEDETDFMGGD
jgi:gamma-glutamyltranspeptidase/glutathione hydrolase